MSEPRKPNEAIAEARRKSVENVNVGVGFCLRAVRECFGVAARDASASEAWAKATHKHRVTSGAQVPRGHAVFWTGGRNGFGHVAISRGNGSCWSTDIKRAGFIDSADIDFITAHWGLTLVGYTDDINGVVVNPDHDKPEPEPKPHVDRDPRDKGYADEARKALHKSVQNTRNETTKSRLRVALGLVRRILRKAH